jgi:hypothetical protein
VLRTTTASSIAPPIAPPNTISATSVEFGESGDETGAVLLSALAAVLCPDAAVVAAGGVAPAAEVAAAAAAPFRLAA